MFCELSLTTWEPYVWRAHQRPRLALGSKGERNIGLHLNPDGPLILLFMVAGVARLVERLLTFQSTTSGGGIPR